MPNNRPIFRYFILALLFVATMAYEVPYLHDVLRNESRNTTFFTPGLADNHISSVSKVAAQAGARLGDELLSVNGQPYTGRSQWFGALANTPVGGNITATLRSTAPGSPQSKLERTVVLPVTSRRPDLWAILGDVMLYFFLPAVCVLLGFWVAVQRPRDSKAWLLLALMLTLPHIFDSSIAEGWPQGWREAAVFYHITLGSMLPVTMFLFGRAFPEPFAAGRIQAKIWNVLLWAVMAPYILLASMTVLEVVISLNSYRTAMALIDQATHRFERIGLVFPYILIGSFFAAMGAKNGASQSADARRRLRVLYWGTTAAWTPALLLVVIYPTIAGKSATELLPQSIIIVVLALLVLFPITLAYVIVVQKAMGVGVVLRQGLQYALAKGGIRVLQVLLMAAVIITAINMAEDSSRDRPQKMTVIASGIIVGFTIRRLGNRVRTWVDRRFFREAYNAEQVLTELSERVPAMIEPKSLVETVAARISETLHVPQVAVLLGGGGLFRPAYAMGYDDLSALSFLPDAGTARFLRSEKEPARVYLHDRESWLYREEDMNEEERGKLSTLHSELLLPLAVRDKFLGFISLGPKKSEEPYTGSDMRLLKTVAVQTGMALENASLMQIVADEVAHRERLNREVEIAREVQERLFPQKLPGIAGLDYSGYCRPALGVGGDYYDFLALPFGHLGVAIGDVSGKGIAAALMMASLQASLRGEATRAPENLAAAVANINRLVYEASSANRYATFFYGQYDPSTHRFDYVNAGHNPPMLFHETNGRWSVNRLDVGGTVVGLLESPSYLQSSITLAPGDVLVAYTDGISEAMNPAEDEWNEERMMETINSCRGLAAEEIVRRVFAAADTFASGAKQHDDMTLVVLRAVSGNNSAPVS